MGPKMYSVRLSLTNESIDLLKNSDWFPKNLRYKQDPFELKMEFKIS